MIKFIKNFRKDEDGAVTVDWVVLTAAIVGLAAVAYSAIGDGTAALSDKIGTEIDGTTVEDIKTKFGTTGG